MLLSNIVKSQTNQLIPSLILAPGETRELSTQRWEFSKVIIPIGATLRITPGSSGYLHLVVRDTFKLQGKIIAREFSSEERQEIINVPGQSPLIIELINSNKGGTGGYGAQAGGNPGGSGALGNTNYGGGGGSGSGKLQQGVKPYIIKYKGISAIDFRGANSPGFCGAMGGNGAKRGDYSNGGIAYFEVYGTFDGTGGLIDVRGNDGTHGAPGGYGTSPSSSYGCSTGGGGGGGGAPGGQGGWVVLYVKGNIIEYPIPITNGGNGGKGGEGKGKASPGTSGTNGENGKAGRFIFFQG